MFTVLDFVGNARPEYDFEHKFRALIGKTHTSVIKEIEDEFPHLPLGCSIVLERKAKEIILKNIREATEFRRPQLVQKIKSFKHHSSSSLNLNNFLKFHHLEIQQVYKKGSWNRLCAEAGVIKDFSEPNEKEITNFISSRLINCNSVSYLKFIKNLCQSNFSNLNFSENERLNALMFHYDIWQKSGPDCNFNDLQESLHQISKNPRMIDEILEVVEILMEEIDFVEKPIELGFEFPLKIHSRYNRNQILVAIRRHKFKKAKPSREGASYEKSINTEALFVTLKKSDKDYSPTTMYEDYALNKNLFHWQTQNSASPNTPKGQAYINSEKNVLLFVREQAKDEYGFTMGYVFLGEAIFQKHSGEKPMNIEWKLEEAMPAYILKESQKLAVG